MFFCWLVAGQWEANSTACCFLSWRCRNYRVADSFRYGFQKGTESQIVQETATGLMLYINNECFSSIRRNYLGNVSSVNRFITWKSRNCVTGVAIWACLNCNIVDIWHMAKFILPVWESGTPSSSWLFVASSSLLAFENHLKRHHVSSQWSSWHTGFSGFLLLKGVVNNRQHYPVWECNDIFLGLSRIPFFWGGGLRQLSLHRESQKSASTDASAHTRHSSLLMGLHLSMRSRSAFLFAWILRLFKCCRQALFLALFISPCFFGEAVLPWQW